MTLSFAAVFSAGLLTALSPCVLPLVPILVAGLVGVPDASRWARLRATVWFGIGFATVFVLLGLSVPALVNVLPGIRPFLLALSAAILMLYGLKMMHVLGTGSALAWMERSAGVAPPHAGGRGAGRSLVLGAVFGFSWTPCAGPILGGVLTYVAAGDGAGVQGGLLLLAYAAGVAAPLLAVAAAAEHVTPYLRALVPYGRAIEAIVGVGLVAVGLLIGAQAAGSDGPPWSARVGDADHETIVGTADGMGQVLFFHSEHCPTCRAMQQLLPALERDCRSNRWALVPVDVDRPENGSLVARFAVHAIPTLSLVDEHGDETEHLVGFQSAARLRQAIEQHLAIACAADTSPHPGDESGTGESTCSVGKAC